MKNKLCFEGAKLIVALPFMVAFFWLAGLKMGLALMCLISADRITTLKEEHFK